ncbi:MAG: hypothetical protein JSW46_12840 [Gemmatimonadota bacterium]|nr:MAG: hypothetical protein JSW46_12840 [Gemmatimonadota bacterium]
MHAPTAIASVIGALAVAAPASAQLAGEKPNAAEPLDYPQPFVTPTVAAGLSVLWLEWKEAAPEKVQFCLDGRVIEDPDRGRVALVENVIPVESGSECRGEWTLGSLLFLLAPGYSDQEVADFACGALSDRPDWHVFGIMRGQDIRNRSLWCANYRSGQDEPPVGASSN